MSSSVFRWPDASEVRKAAGEWCDALLRSRPDALRAGYLGSYARGDAGVGSDLDIVVVLERCEHPFHRRGALLETSSLPVPADLLVYTREEFDSILARGDRFARELRQTAVWFDRDRS